MSCSGIQQSIFTHLFSLPESWDEVLLVKLCQEDLFLRVCKRIEKLCRSISVLTDADLTEDLNVAVKGRHFRPENPEKLFSTYSELTIFDPENSHRGVVFVISDLNDLSKNMRGDKFMDVFDEIYSHSESPYFAGAAFINASEYWMSWTDFFSVGEVRLPASGESRSVAAWAVGDAKQRIVDLAYSSALRGPIVEIGRLFGGTAALLGLAVKEARKVSEAKMASAVFSFDPFPHVYNQRFMDIYAVQDDVALCDMSSEEGRYFWKHEGLPPIAFLHIDGDHRYEAVCDDVNGWYPLLADGAVIMFDDYGYNAVSLAGSTRAIHDCIIARPDRWRDIHSVSRALVAIKGLSKNSPCQGTSESRLHLN